MNKTWLTADLHLGETRFELMGRPFSTQFEHIETLITNHNKLVSPDDTVIVNGDVCYQKTPEFLKHVERFNGKKTLIRGNHDKVFSDDDLKPYFETIIPEGEGIDMVISDIPCYITHYPTEGKIDKFNLVGHIHSAWKYNLNSMNIGVDVNHFRPINIDTIPFHYNAICNFYDRDVWVAYDKINLKYLGSRGKQNSYFRP